MAKAKLSKTFGTVVRRRRQALKLSQERLAEKAHIHPTHVGLIERAARNPSLDVAHALALALETTLSELISECEDLHG